MSRGEEARRARIFNFSAFADPMSDEGSLYNPRPPQRMPGMTDSHSPRCVFQLPTELPFRRLQPSRLHLQLRDSCSPPACHSVQIQVSSIMRPALFMNSHSTSQTVDPSRPDALPSVSAPLSMIFERLELRWQGTGCSCRRSVHVFYWYRRWDIRQTRSFPSERHRCCVREEGVW